MGVYKYLTAAWKENKHPELYRENLIKWRREGSTTKLETPTRLDRARALGYKAKQGFFVVRARVPRGGKKRPTIRKGRRSKHFHLTKTLTVNYQWIAENRTAKKYHNCEVLNSYFVGKDGKHYWFEVLIVDPEIVKKYDGMEWILRNRNRPGRGLTNAARKSRGLRHKGKGVEKKRPSLAANIKKKNQNS